MSKEKIWKEFLKDLKQNNKIKYIRNEKMFIEYNTYLLTPEVSLSKYLGIEDPDAKKSNSSDFKKVINHLISSLIERKTDCVNAFMSNPQSMDFVISMYTSYECLSRIVDMVTSIEEIINNIGLPTQINLPTSGYSQAIMKKMDVRYVFSTILCAMLERKLSNLIERLSVKDDVYFAIAEEIRSLENKLNEVYLLLNLFYDISESLKKPFLDFLYYLFDVSKRGSKKAISGLNYESLLIDYLSSKLSMEGISILPSGKYEDKNIDGYIIYNQRRIGIFESTYSITTSSSQTSRVNRILERSRLDNLSNEMIVLIILIDGAGWLARISDAKKFIDSANLYPHVWTFTYHKESLRNLVNLIDNLASFFKMFL